MIICDNRNRTKHAARAPFYCVPTSNQPVVEDTGALRWLSRKELKRSQLAPCLEAGRGSASCARAGGARRRAL